MTFTDSGPESRISVLLWDIDGTLIRTGGAGMLALTKALAQFTGKEEDLSTVNLAGSMDGAVFEKICAPRGIHIDALSKAYLELLPQCLASCNGRIPPGVRKVLEITGESSQFCNGLLTGNIYPGAIAKLSHFGLWDFFKFGAFGNEASLRNELGPIAMEKANRYVGRLLPRESFWIIGDTARDVAVAKACGFRCLAVGTGFSPVGEIQAAGPDVFFSDLSDTEAVVRVLSA
jgi:phosphoglycolate phosphatase-like HAD superfamily hydrolase